MRKMVRKDKSEELKAQLARALADYDNLRKRTDSEKGVWVKFASERVLAKLLPTLDILENAQGHLKDQGLGMAILEFKKVLGEEGLAEINPKEGEAFNPEVHEALESVEGGKKGNVAGTVLTGWKFSDGPVIRVAKVKVYAEKSKKKEELEKEVVRGDYV